MYVGVARVSLYMPETFSLKEKRKVVRSVVERMRHRFNASIAEIEDLDDMRVGTIGIAVLSNSGRHADEMLQTILTAIERDAMDATIGEIETDVVAF